MKENFVLEIGVEDLPSSCGDYLQKNFLPLILEKLKEERIEFSNAGLYYTPRRIIIFIKEMEEKQKDIVKEIYGPPLEVSLDENGNWKLPAIKFASLNNVDVSDLKIVEKKGKKFLVIQKEEKGKPVKGILNKVINEAIEKLEIPKGMIWNEKGFKFFRPIRYIFSIYGSEKVNIEIGGYKSKKYTFGHRVLSDRKIYPKNTNDYFDKILKNFVIFDQQLRKEIIEKLIEKIVGDEKVYFDRNIVNSIVPLVEYPVFLICDLPENYKNLPPEVLNILISNIKGIPFFTQEGGISNFFGVVCDGVCNKKIKENYEKVVEGKIQDAIFFMKQDLKKPFIDYFEDLKNIVYHPKLGSIYDRVERVKNICKFILDELNLSKELWNKIELICSLFKNDIATLMGTEYPSLQGVIGRIYAERNGYPEEIAKVIEEHYLPRFPGDKVPEKIESAIVSVADRIEMICGLISEGIEIKGDEDPLGIKKTTNGLIEIIWKNKIDIEIEKLIDFTLKILGKDKSVLRENILNFIMQRVENILALEGIKSVFRKSVFSVENKSIYEIRRKIDAIKEVFKEGKGADILIPFIRVANMLKQAEEKKIKLGEFSERFLIEKEEKELYRFYIENYKRMVEFFEKKKYKEFLEEMRKWKKPIDNFFDKVFVMVEEENLRNNRIGLLKLINDIFIRFADFSKIPLKEVENA